MSGSVVSESGSDHEISCFYQNVRGLNTKTVDFFLSVCSASHDIIAIAETWINENVRSSELFDDRYTVFRCDRDFVGMEVSRGGGVALAVRRELLPAQLDLQTFRSSVTKIDMVGCKLNFTHQMLYAFVVYVPPSVSIGEFLTFIEYLEALRHLYYSSNLIILGDFNVPNYQNNISDQKGKILANFCDMFQLMQFNDIQNSHNSVLDLVLSNINNCRVTKEQIPLTAEDAYHPSLNILLSGVREERRGLRANASELRYNFRKANYPALYDMILTADWSSLYTVQDINDACINFYGTLYKIFDECVPKSLLRNRTFPVWFTSDIIKLVKRKQRMFKRLKRSNSNWHRNKYNELRREIKKRVHLAYTNYLRKAEASIREDPRSFWSFIKLKKSTTSLPQSFTDDGLQCSYTDPKEIADAFAHFFCSMYCAPTPTGHNYLQGSADLFPLVSLPCLNDDMILAALAKSKNKFTQGPDKIPCFIIKDCARALLRPLSFIYNLSLKSNTFPEIWKMTRITPVFKKGDTSNISNYRPVSILSPFAKVFEMAIYDSLFKQIKERLTQAQHGFFGNRSTVSNLASFAQFTGKALDGRQQVDAIYTDFTKAFDRIDHSILALKLANMGFHDDLISFLRSYLDNRIQYVDIRGHHSFQFIATSGAPQGSNLSPLLFSIFINDIVEPIASNILLFADDLKLFRVIHSIDDCIILQKDIRTIENWCSINKLTLNLRKCFVMSFSNQLNPTHYDYVLDKEIMNRCYTFRDLGVVFDTRLSFASHIDQVCRDALKMLGFIFRNSRGLVDIGSLKVLYFCYVRSKLEYGAVIWHPIYHKYIDRIENIQRRFLKFLCFRDDGTYPPRGIEGNILLTRFNMPSLMNRRIYLLVQFLFKICKSFIDCPDLLSQISFHVPSRFTRFPHVFCLNTPRTNILMKTPLYQSMNIFNVVCSDLDMHNLTHAQFSKLMKMKVLNARWMCPHL